MKKKYVIAVICGIFGFKQYENHQFQVKSLVSVASAQTYKYLINNRAKSYREVELHGKNAQHSKLHENKTIDKELIKFLWHK